MRFVLAGDDRPARRVAEFIAQRAELAGWYTTQSDRPGIRGVAERAGAVLHHVDQLSNKEHIPAEGDWLLTVNCDRLVPGRVIESYRHRALNLHNGPLPAYAGRHVTQWAIRRGEVRFASTIHFLDSGVDSGDVVSEVWYDIKSDDTGLTLFERSFRRGTELMLKTVETIIGGGVLERRPQDPAFRSVYRHRDALCPKIDWTLSGKQIVDFVRAGNYRPLRSPTYTAAVKVGEHDIKVLRAGFEAGSGLGAPGEIVAVGEEGVCVRCSDGTVCLTELQEDDKVVELSRYFRVGDLLGMGE